MFADENLGDTDADCNRDDDGAKRRFFGGERFLDSISGAAYVIIFSLQYVRRCNCRDRSPKTLILLHFHRNL